MLQEDSVLRDRINRLVDQSKDKILEHLEALVNIQSGTSNIEGVNHVIDKCQESFESLGFFVQRKSKKNFGAHLIAKGPSSPGAKILVIGHADTVFPPEQPQRFFKRKGHKCWGPGVLDMKGGLVCAIKGLELLHNAYGGLRNRIVVIVNSDEEVGSTSSRPYIEAEAKKADFVLIMEPSLSRRTVVIARAGNARYYLTIHGRAAHVCNPDKGVSAIKELAYKIIALEDISNLKNDTMINVGVVEGGIAHNVLSPSASATIDLRFGNLENGVKAIQRIQEITNKSYVAGTQSKIEGDIGRPPMTPGPGVQPLFSVLKQIAAQNRWRLGHAYSRAVSDANFTSDVGVPTMDGLGPCGDYAHSEKEFIYTESLFERCKFIGQILGTDYAGILPKLRGIRSKPNM